MRSLPAMMSATGSNSCAIEARRPPSSTSPVRSSVVAATSDWAPRLCGPTPIRSRKFAHRGRKLGGVAVERAPSAARRISARPRDRSRPGGRRRLAGVGVEQAAPRYPRGPPATAVKVQTLPASAARRTTGSRTASLASIALDAPVQLRKSAAQAALSAGRASPGVGTSFGQLAVGALPVDRRDPGVRARARQARRFRPPGAPPSAPAPPPPAIR